MHCQAPPEQTVNWLRLAITAVTTRKLLKLVSLAQTRLEGT